MSNDPFPNSPYASSGPPPGKPFDPPQRSIPIWVWLLGGGAVLLALPFCCCGGLLVFAGMQTDFTLRNGEHLGGSPMNVKFDYELRESHGMPKAYTIVCRSADGTTRDRPIGGGFINLRGTMTFNTFDAGTNVRGPVQVWIESSDGFGRGKSTASNTLTIRPKK